MSKDALRKRAWREKQKKFTQHKPSPRGQEKYDMTTVQKNALNALHTAALALAASTAALVASFDSDTTPAAAEPATTEPKKKKERAAEPAAKPAETAPAAEVAPKAAEAPKAGDNVLDQCRKAAQEYAGTFGREGLRKVLDKYAPGKSLADVPADKLPELLKDLS